jgi:hypothetical protein
VRNAAITILMTYMAGIAGAFAIYVTDITTEGRLKAEQRHIFDQMSAAKEALRLSKNKAESQLKVCLQTKPPLETGSILPKKKGPK